MKLLKFMVTRLHLKMSYGNLKREKESLLIAAQNVIRTNYVIANIDYTQKNILCRLCGDRSKMVNHMISECSMLA